jgi:hypothetical protein
MSTIDKIEFILPKYEYKYFIFQHIRRIPRKSASIVNTTSGATRATSKKILCLN